MSQGYWILVIVENRDAGNYKHSFVKIHIRSAESEPETGTVTNHANMMFLLDKIRISTITANFIWH